MNVKTVVSRGKTSHFTSYRRGFSFLQYVESKRVSFRHVVDRLGSTHAAAKKIALVTFWWKVMVPLATLGSFPTKMQVAYAMLGEVEEQP